jgi:polyhydroxybutyrate depolymerase
MRVSSGGVERSAVVYVPETLVDRRGRSPLVLTLHGSQSNASEQLTRDGLESKADAAGFVLAAPEGLLPTGPGTSRWNVPFVTEPDGPDDERFLLDLIDALAAGACVDSRRVYAAGYSGGGRMISALACDHPERIAALIPVAGLRFGPPVADGRGGFVPDPSRCAPDRPVPVLAFAGTADAVNPYDGGGAPYWGYGNLAAAREWAANNGCWSTPVVRRVTPHVSQLAYRGCRAGADVVLYTVHGGGHTWPGSTIDWGGLGPVTTEISANDLLWDFARNRVSP